MELMFMLSDIQQAAEKLLPLIAKNNVLAFHGAMGAGKTTFIHALTEQMGVKDHVSSPTYSIINEYATVSGKKIWHLDLYRLRDEAEAIQAGVEDCLYSGDSCFVEWPEKASGIFPPETLHINIEVGDNNSRKISW